jgi:hypothetical protein
VRRSEAVAPPRSLMEPIVPVPPPMQSVESHVAATSPSPAPILPPSRWREIDPEPSDIPQPFEDRLSRRTILVG